MVDKSQVVAGRRGGGKGIEMGSEEWGEGDGDPWTGGKGKVRSRLHHLLRLDSLISSPPKACA